MTALAAPPAPPGTPERVALRREGTGDEQGVVQVGGLEVVVGVPGLGPRRKDLVAVLIFNGEREGHVVGEVGHPQVDLLDLPLNDRLDRLFACRSAEDKIDFQPLNSFCLS